MMSEIIERSDCTAKVEFLNELGLGRTVCVNKKYHNDKYVHLRVSALENNCTIDSAHASPVSFFEKLF